MGFRGVICVYFSVMAVLGWANTRLGAHETGRVGKGVDPLEKRLQFERAILKHLEKGYARFEVNQDNRVISDVDEGGKLFRYLGGCAVSVVSHDEEGKSSTLFQKGFGDTNRGRWFNPPDPITPEHSFLMASSSKPITALGILILRDRLAKEGKGDLLTLKLSEIFKQGGYLNGWKMPGFASVSTTGDDKIRDITVRDLLTHTSGLARTAEYYVGSGLKLKELSKAPHLRNGSGDDCSVVRALMEYRPRTFDPKRSDFSSSSEREYQARKWVKAEIDRTGPRPHAPGTTSYSSAGTSVLACVIEHLSKQSLNDFFQGNVFGPLGMKSSTFVDPTIRASESKYAVGRRVNDKGASISPHIDLGRVDLEKEWQPRTYGSAALIAPVADLAKLSSVFDDLENDRKAKIAISPKTWKDAMAFHPDTSREWNFSATGWTVKPVRQFPVRGDETYYMYHNGSWAGHGTALYRVSRRQPRCNLWISVACNIGNYQAFVPWDIARDAEATFCSVAR